MKQKRIRVSFDFPEKIHTEIVDMAIEAGCSSKSELVRQALKFYRIYLDKITTGHSLYYERFGEKTKLEVLL